jgi:ferredoxin
MKIKIDYEHCQIQCRDCVRACPTGALEKWFDTIEYSNNKCEPDYCMKECISACKYHALKIE